MEWVQTLWTAFTTPNEGLIGIIFNNWGIPFIFVEAFVSALLFTQVLNVKYTKKQLLIYVLTISIISAIVNTFIGKPYSSYFNMVIEPIIIMLIFKVNLFKAILAEFIPIIFTIILETVLGKIFMILLNLEYESLYTIPLTRLLITMLIYLSMYLIYRFIKHFKINIPLIENMSKRNKLILILNSVFAIIAIGMQIYIICFYLVNLPLAVTLMSLLSLVVYFSISIFSLLKTTSLEKTAQSLEEAKLYNKTLSLLHENLRIFKHEYSNTLQSIEGYIANNDMEGLKEYYNSISHEFANSNNLTALSPKLISDPGLYSLIASKYHTAEQDGIIFNINICVNFNDIKASAYTLTRILGVLLDNALEAARESEEKEISFEVTGPYTNASISKYVITIENTYSNKDVNLDRIREKGYTSKTHEEGSHGLGLYEVNKILKRSKNLNLHTTKNDKFFKQQLEIFDIKD